MCFVFLRRPRVAPRGRPRAPGARRPGQDRAPVFSALIAPRPRAQDRSTERCFENDDHVVHRHFRRPVLTSVLEKVVSPIIHFDVVFTVFPSTFTECGSVGAPRVCVSALSARGSNMDPGSRVSSRSVGHMEPHYLTVWSHILIDMSRGDSHISINI
jgi:hypothetical protein